MSYCSAYKTCRIKVNIEVKKAKRAYFKGKLTRTEKKSKQTCKILNEVMGRNSS